MLDLDTRRVILALRAKGLGVRAIARAVRVSRNAVRGVLKSSREEVARLERAELVEEHLDRVRELYTACQGNMVRVHEELAKEGVAIAYSTLTAFCRRHGIGTKPKVAAGSYHFEPGEEMQHDTSPHEVMVGGRLRQLHCASLVMCYSSSVYAQTYPVWNRFHSKIFLTEAIVHFGGACERCMLDNSSVVIARGRGANAVPAPEMEAFAERFGFRFVAHEVGDANRSARVESSFFLIERNFYPGRKFADLADLNAQLREWCDRRNATPKGKLRLVPRELFAVEQPRLKPLPPYVPEVYELHHRTIDLEGLVHLHGNRYSVPEKLVGRQVEIRETKDRVRVFHGHDEVVVHEKSQPGARVRVMLPEHRRRGIRARRDTRACRYERELEAAGPELGAMVTALKQHHGGRVLRFLRELHRMYLDYPDEPLCAAVAECLKYGLLDLRRLERMVLKRIAGNYFKLPVGDSSDDDE